MAEDYTGMGLSDEELAALQEDDDIEDEGGDTQEEDLTNGEDTGDSETGGGSDQSGADDQGGDKPGDEAGAEATDTGTEGEVGSEEEEEGIDDAPDFKPEPLVDADKANARLSEIDTALKDANEKYEAGDYDTEEYRAVERKLLDERVEIKTELRVSEAMETKTIQNDWLRAQYDYLGDHPELMADPIIKKVFANEVNELLASEAGAAMSNKALLAGAYKKIAHLIPDTAKSAAQKKVDEKASMVAKAKKEAADRAKAGKPQTLADTTSAEGNEDAGRFAYLDSLTGEALEAALDKLSEKELQEWEDAN
ncbi:MAG: hypothetical protein JW724_03275 [Candidatus Altiarchaeota archaeon]|nr:hypothetical protein [Candidatus Altiarchaeota archaeon]